MAQSDSSQDFFWGARQFRMDRLQLFNWGTFSDLHDIHISERGFLFTGRSGSGKSTILDAIAALLVPPKWADFNAAARETDRSGRDRNILTYLRGAWGDQKDEESGLIATQYLRSGTTWSALALTYKDGHGRVVTLMQLFTIKGNSNNNNDVKRYFFIFERAFDLVDLDGFDLDIRKLRQSIGSDVFYTDEFGRYCERFRRLLGIDNELALRLLQKTQSAKNLGDLNLFLRDFMLEKPETFDAADRLINEFSELDQAHRSVVTARRQVNTLRPARESQATLTSLNAAKAALEELKTLVDPYCERQRIRLIQQRLTEGRTELEAVTAEISQLDARMANVKRELHDLEQQHREKGGDLLEKWEAEKAECEQSRQQRATRRKAMEETCGLLGWTVPDSPDTFARTVARARATVEQSQAGARDLRDRIVQVTTSKEHLQRSLAQAQREIQALRRQPSNIPSDMLDLRRQIASAIGVSESALPFAGELMEVRKEESPWQGAIERVLRGFAVSLLVEERHYAALSNYVNATDLKGRLFYYKTDKSNHFSGKELGSTSLVRKLNIKPGIHAEWLLSELRNRFDYACVESAQALKNVERGLTIEGLVRHSWSRHEKDDRRAIGDRRNWVLGFSNKDKLNLFVREAQELEGKILEATESLQELVRADEHLREQALHCQLLVNLDWLDVDVTSVVERIANLQRLIDQSRQKNLDLQKLAGQISRQKKILEDYEREWRKLGTRQTRLDEDIAKLSKNLASLRENSRFVTFAPAQLQELDARFAAGEEELSLENVDKVTRRVDQELERELRAIDKSIFETTRVIESAFADFKREWPAESANMDANINSSDDFFALLSRLETDGLPRFEQRFFELLQTQSHQNLAALSTHLSQARKAIHDRMEMVNDSLKGAPFNPGTYLYIQTIDRQLAEVRDFKQDITEALSYSLDDDRERAEERFNVMRRIVSRLASKEPDDRRWRDAVLDVRQHVEFVAHELDSRGMQVEIYRSGAGKSGGQRQKLATTCLAAALHYQLSRNEDGVPQYAAVVLDEAFDKADNEFTELAMNIFVRFGFQMIVATPLKSVRTLEPFIGGACFVEISDRRKSAVLPIKYIPEQQRLELPHAVNAEISVAVS
ncbi:MAG TPA: ATP-binding protein [Candidatus Obscuribacterales bacterium]